MEHFTYHRKGARLRNRVNTILALLSAEMLAYLIIGPFLPHPANWALIGFTLPMAIFVYWFIPREYRLGGHQVSESEFIFRTLKVRVLIPRRLILSAAPYRGPVPKVEIGPEYRAHWDAVAHLPDLTRVVDIHLSEPVSAVLKRGKPEISFTRLFLSVDEPERLVAALTAPRLSEPADSQVTLKPSSPSHNSLSPSHDSLSPSHNSPSPSHNSSWPSHNSSSPSHSSPSPSHTLPSPSHDSSSPSRNVPALSHTPPSPSLDAPSSPTGAPLLHLDGLAKRFGDFQAVHPLHLTLHPGEILAFLGANGAGKTTTLRMLTGLLRPTSGTVQIAGIDAWADPRAARRRFGYVPDTPLLWEGLTANEFLWLMAGLHAIPEAEAKRRSAELLQSLGLTRWSDGLLRHFSLGMKRKMAIAAALIHQPDLLLLDEVTNGLDPRASRDVKDWILSAARAGKGVMLTTHILDLAEELADRIAILDGGRLRAIGTLEELRAEAGLPGASLERLFLALTGERLEVMEG